MITCKGRNGGFQYSSHQIHQLVTPNACMVGIYSATRGDSPPISFCGPGPEIAALFAEIHAELQPPPANDPVQELIAAAESLLVDALDRNECHDENSGEMYHDWSALKQALTAAKKQLPLQTGCVSAIAACKAVVENWERGDLAAAVRSCAQAIQQTKGEGGDKAAAVALDPISVIEAMRDAYGRLHDLTSELVESSAARTRLQYRKNLLAVISDQLAGPCLRADSLADQFFENKRKGGPEIYTVIGFWPDTRQKFCDYFTRDNADIAQVDAEVNHPGLIVTAVIRGKHTPADTEALITQF